MRPEGCFVIKVPKQRKLFLYISDSEQAASWERVLRACAKVHLPSRKTASEAPQDTPIGLSATISSARDIGTNVLYKAYVAHWNPDVGYERFTTILDYETLMEMQTELFKALPDIVFPQLPTSRV